MATQTNKKKARNDLIFILALLAVLAIVGGCLLLLRGEGNTVTVQVDQQVYGTYSLAENRVVDIPSAEGGHNRLVIQDGQAHMESASCPDGICVAHHPIHRDGESIVCLPNRVVITVTLADGAEESPDIIL